MNTGEPRALRQVALASYVGSAIEFYDFFIYGTAAALVFPTVFFPHLGHVMATVASLGTFAAAFVSRPIGAVVFGHFGDRIGRQRTLVVTLLLMGVATVGVGLLPSAATIGVAAPLLLTGLRILQGFAVGGEWAGSALLSAEHAPPNQRGRYGMFTQMGYGTALVLANLVFLIVYLTCGPTSAAFVEWAWRIPFLLSVVLIVTALAVRMSVDETPAFAGATAHSEVPLAALVRDQGRQLLLAAGAVIGVLALVYETGTFFTHYATEHLSYSTDFVLLVGVLGGLCTVAFVIASAILSDTHGRRLPLTVGYLLAVPWSLIVFPLIETRNHILFAVAIIVTYAIIGIVMGPLASFVPETFALAYRYTGAGLAHNIGGILGGGIPPVISEYLLDRYGSWSIAALLAGLTLVSLISVRMLKETAALR
ncbi:MFS transporter [Mycobacterium sp. shizuoka-1]|nr:MFS transporter [Mycobacterium sp. shizuoka-1]GAY18409.1 MFS transporter [Mycobacterium sp. shizuoka-1]